jgi:hypothetical protein
VCAERYPGFESLPLRHELSSSHKYAQNKEIRFKCQEYRHLGGFSRFITFHLFSQKVFLKEKVDTSWTESGQNSCRLLEPVCSL